MKRIVGDVVAGAALLLVLYGLGTALWWACDRWPAFTWAVLIVVGIGIAGATGAAVRR